MQWSFVAEDRVSSVGNISTKRSIPPLVHPNPTCTSYSPPVPYAPTLLTSYWKTIFIWKQRSRGEVTVNVTATERPLRQASNILYFGPRSTNSPKKRRPKIMLDSRFFRFLDREKDKNVVRRMTSRTRRRDLLFLSMCTTSCFQNNRILVIQFFVKLCLRQFQKNNKIHG